MTDAIRVLHIDDDPEFADLTATFLQRYDPRFNVKTTSNPDEVLDRLSETEFDCIISDYDMPGQNGIELLEKIREHHSELPFILYTGKGSEEVASSAISAGVTDYLQKEAGTDQYALLANRIINNVERAQAKEEREYMRQRMELALSNTDSVIYEITLDTGDVTRLGQFSDYFDYAPEDVPTWQDHLENIVHPADQEKFRRFYEELTQGDRTAGTLEYRTNPNEGTVRWIRDTISLVDDGAKALGLAQDITKQKQDQHELQETKNRFQALFENAPVPVIAGDVSEDGETHLIRDVNDEFEEVFGYDTDDVVGHDVKEIVIPEEGMDRHEAFREQASAGEAILTEVERLTVDGPRKFLLHNIPYGVDGDTADGWYAWYTDISALKHREHSIKELQSSTTDLIGAKTKQDVADLTVAAVRDILDMPANGVHLYDEEADGLVPVAWTDETEAIVGTPPTFAIGEGIAGTAYETNEPQIHDDIQSVPERYNPETDIRSQIALPFGKHGVLLIGSPESGAFDDTDISLAKTLAGPATAALDRIEREADLARRTNLLEAILETSIDGILVINEDREYEMWNQQFLDMWGMPEELISDKPEEIGLEWAVEKLEDPEEFIEKVEYLYAHPDEESRDEIQLSDGRVFDRYSAPVTMEDGLHIGRVWFFRDITERIERERELELYRTMIETIPDGVYALDEELRYITVNEGMEHLTGYSKEELIGSHLSTVLSEESVEMSKQNRRKLRESDEDPVMQFERTHYKQDGTPVRCDVRFKALPTGDDEDFQGTVGVVRDVSEQRRREAALERQNDRLDEFASIVSHDLRNPLRVAQGQVELAREDCESEHLDDIARAHDRMEALIEDLLTLAQEGEQSTEEEEVNLGRLIEMCWQNVPTHDATINIGIDRTIRADRSRLTQLVENIIGNAVEHGGEDVAIAVGELADGFYIEDNGPGIPVGDRDAIFDADYSTADGGTGFGLSIVKQVAEAHDWDIRVTEGPDGGARFEVTGVEFL